jgi:acyl dehydratase
MIAAAVLALADLHEGMTAGFDFTIEDADMEAFSLLSGDRSPLHRDQAFAENRGFSGCVVYGALLVARVSRLIGMELPGRDSLWNSLQIQFVAPLIVGEPARLEASVAQISESTRSVALQLKVISGSKTVARGKALVSIL